MMNENNNTPIHTEPYDWYVENELKPALEWLETEEAKHFIPVHFPELGNILYHNPDKPFDSAYTFYLRTATLYIGEAAQYSRLAVHMWHMYREPETYFGIRPEEVKYVRFLKDNETLPIREDRIRREQALISMKKPILQQGNKDRCIPRNDRYQEVHKWYNNSDKLAEVIIFVAINASGYFGWHELYRAKTPCCDNRTLEIPYGLAERIEEYINSLKRKDRAKLLLRMAQNIGGGYWTTRKATVTILSRLLAVDDPHDLISMVQMAAKYRIQQDQKMLSAIEKSSKVS